MAIVTNFIVRPAVIVIIAVINNIEVIGWEIKITVIVIIIEAINIINSESMEENILIIANSIEISINSIVAMAFIISIIATIIIIVVRLSTTIKVEEKNKIVDVISIGEANFIMVTVLILNIWNHYLFLVIEYAEE